MEIKPVILSGGSGVRLWPLSRLNKAKQFVDLFKNGSSLFLETVKRISKDPFAPPLIIANNNHRFEILKSIKKYNLKTDKVILETLQKNTAPACAVASFYSEEDSILCIMPSDHYIEDTIKFKHTIIKASKIATKGYLVTVGARPRHANTNYGYIVANKKKKFEGGYKIEKFVEKPNFKKAKELLSNQAFWNTGIIIVKNSVLKELFIKNARSIYETSIRSCKKAKEDREFILLSNSPWKNIKSISFDYAILEKKFDKVIIPIRGKWSDLGTFESLSDIKNMLGDILSIKSKNNITFSDEKLLVTLGVENLIIINTKNAVLVSSKDSSKNLRLLVEKLKNSNREEAYNDSEESRPWGSFQNIKSEKTYKVKKLLILPGEKISLQKHLKRSEHWVVVEGKAKITKGKQVFTLKTNESTFIKKGEIHRIENSTKSNLIIIEVQTGSYLKEDDIIRIEDKYKR